MGKHCRMERRFELDPREPRTQGSYSADHPHAAAETQGCPVPVAEEPVAGLDQATALIKRRHRRLAAMSASSADDTKSAGIGRPSYGYLPT